MSVDTSITLSNLRLLPATLIVSADVNCPCPRKMCFTKSLEYRATESCCPAVRRQPHRATRYRQRERTGITTHKRDMLAYATETKLSGDCHATPAALASRALPLVEYGGG